MKSLNFLVASLVAAFATVSAFAATATATFPVNITLNSGCSITTAGAVSFTYTSMQTTAATATGTTASITCTNTLPYSVSLATAPGYGYNVTDAKTNLAYTLTLNGSAADLLAQTGTGLVQPVLIGGTMAANQAGTCNLASCQNNLSANQNQTLTITY